jgi:tetratricopeptide (TPR) repeat protein
VPELETYDDGLADFDYTGTDDLEEGGLGTAEESTTNVGQYSARAAQGALSSTEVLMLEMIDTPDPEYTRSRLLLVMDARRKGDQRGMKRYLDDVMSQPENAYNPVVLTEYGRYYANRGDYERALQKATLAERHWARIPSELIFMKKAEIYEIQAAAYQGLFYKSEGNLDLLDKSIRGWTKYRDHAATKSRGDLSSKASREITKLQSIRERLQ